jgi:hypothetical protein
VFEPSAKSIVNTRLSVLHDRDDLTTCFLRIQHCLQRLPLLHQLHLRPWLCVDAPARLRNILVSPTTHSFYAHPARRVPNTHFPLHRTAPLSIACPPLALPCQLRLRAYVSTRVSLAPAAVFRSTSEKQTTDWRSRSCQSAASYNVRVSSNSRLRAQILHFAVVEHRLPVFARQYARLSGVHTREYPHGHSRA